MTAVGPVSLVTGGGSGIGRATVLRLVADGHRVSIVDVNESAAEETVQLVRKTASVSDQVLALTADIRSEADVSRMVTDTVEHFGRLDTLVNNAGVGGAFGAVGDVEVEDWDYTFAVMARGVFLGIKHASRVLPDGGSIVNVASAAAFSGSFGPMAYSAAKAAVLSITRSAALELAARFIRVNAVCPGAIRTPLLDGGRPENLDSLLPVAQPLPRWGMPDDIADVIAFLASQDSRFVTGESILVDGGLVASGPGPEFQARMGNDPRARGLAGVNRGTTGERSQVRRRPTA